MGRQGTLSRAAAFGSCPAAAATTPQPTGTPGPRSNWLHQLAQPACSRPHLDDDDAGAVAPRLQQRLPHPQVVVVHVWGGRGEGGGRPGWDSARARQQRVAPPAVGLPANSPPAGAGAPAAAPRSHLACSRLACGRLARAPMDSRSKVGGTSYLANSELMLAWGGRGQAGQGGWGQARQGGWSRWGGVGARLARREPCTQAPPLPCGAAGCVLTGVMNSWCRLMVGSSKPPSISRPAGWRGSPGWAAAGDAAAAADAAAPPRQPPAVPRGQAPGERTRPAKQLPQRARVALAAVLRAKLRSRSAARSAAVGGSRREHAADRKAAQRRHRRRCCGHGHSRRRAAATHSRHGDSTRSRSRHRRQHAQPQHSRRGSHCRTAGAAATAAQAPAATGLQQAHLDVAFVGHTDALEDAGDDAVFAVLRVNPGVCAPQPPQPPWRRRRDAGQRRARQAQLQRTAGAAGRAREETCSAGAAGPHAATRQPKRRTMPLDGCIVHRAANSSSAATVPHASAVAIPPRQRRPGLVRAGLLGPGIGAAVAAAAVHSAARCRRCRSRRRSAAAANDRPGHQRQATPQHCRSLQRAPGGGGRPGATVGAAGVGGSAAEPARRWRDRQRTHLAVRIRGEGGGGVGAAAAGARAGAAGGGAASKTQRMPCPPLRKGGSTTTQQLPAATQPQRDQRQARAAAAGVQQEAAGDSAAAADEQRAAARRRQQPRWAQQAAAARARALHVGPGCAWAQREWRFDVGRSPAGSSLDVAAASEPRCGRCQRASSSARAACPSARVACHACHTSPPAFTFLGASSCVVGSQEQAAATARRTAHMLPHGQQRWRWWERRRQSGAGRRHSRSEEALQSPLFKSRVRGAAPAIAGAVVAGWCVRWEGQGSAQGSRCPIIAGQKR